METFHMCAINDFAWRSEPDWIIGAWVEREAYIAGIGVLCFLHTVLRKRKNFLCNITISVKSEFCRCFYKNIEKC